jgi:hypothetical protein
VKELSAEEAAVKLDVTPHRVRQLCRAGQLDARQVSGAWLIDPISVELRAGRVARWPATRT